MLRINALEPQMHALSDAQLAAKTQEFRARLDGQGIVATCVGRQQQGELQAALTELLPEAFAVAREASRRVLGMRHFDSQLVGRCPWVVCFGEPFRRREGRGGLWGFFRT